MDRLDFLRNQPLTDGLNEEELIILSFLLEEKAYDKDSLIIEEKEDSYDIYFIIEGEVSLFKWNALHKTWFLIDILKKGDMFGEMAFLDSSPRSSRAVSNEYTVLWMLPQGKLDIASIHNKIVKNIGLIGINRLRITTEKYINDQKKIA
jgi:CRP-like cAMP-binding protein